MNLDRLQGMWQQLGGRMQEHWATLTDDPAAAAAARRERLAVRVMLQRRISIQQTSRKIRHFLVRDRNWKEPTSR